MMIYEECLPGLGPEPKDPPESKSYNVWSYALNYTFNPRYVLFMILYELL